ncbi:hypothetical protein HAX54_027517, partial [Datura stramonium]|nr:hypothetical protein [Datura stramonium]
MYESLTTLCKRVDAVEGGITSLRTEVREWRSRTSMEVPNLSALDAAMDTFSKVRGPLDDLFEGLGDDVEDPGDVGFEGE